MSSTQASPPRMTKPDRLVRGNLALTLEATAASAGWATEPAYRVGEARHTYADVYDGMRTTAAVLSAHGVTAGQRILLALPDSIEFVWAFLGTLYLGAVAVLANPSLPARELTAAAATADPELVVCDEETAGAYGGLPGLTPARIANERNCAVPVPAAAAAPAGPAYALFTSGTTGEPKLCFHRHGDALIHNRAFGRPALRLGPGDVTLSVSKTYFAYGLGNSVFYPLLSGAAAVLAPFLPTADTVLGDINRHGARVLFAVPSFYARLIRHPQAETLAMADLAVCAGEILPPAVEQAISALAGPVLLNGIGSTEFGQTFASNTLFARRASTVGRALPPYRVRVADNRGTDLPPNSEGQLLVQGATLAVPCAAARCYTPAPPGTWYPTGDLAALSPDGYLSIAGRLDDVEIVGGINVRPAEVEDLLARHPLVRDVAVCATVDARGVSQLAAYIVPAAAETDSVRLEADLLADVRQQLAHYKVPRRVVPVPRLPRTFTGKLQRRRLRETAAHHARTGTWQLPGAG
jgi:4-hydroxybenzoate adenylyltransferase